MHRRHIWFEPNRFAFIADHDAVDPVMADASILAFTWIQSADTNTTQSSATNRARRDGMFRTHNELSQTIKVTPTTRVTEKSLDLFAQA